MKRLNTEQDLDDMRRAAQGLAVIFAWSSAGLFKVLADGSGKTADQLPAHARAIARTAPVLVHLGLLVRDGERLALTRQAQALLATGALTGSSAGALADLALLDSVLKSGEPVRATEGGVVADDREASRAFMDMLYRRSGDSAKEVARFLVPRLPPGARVLDLGGGHGRYARILADNGLHATLFDVPLCIELARERHGAALAYAAGDFLKDDLGGPYDAVLLSNIVHGMPPLQVRSLLDRVRAVLAPGGIAVLKDMLLDEHGANPEEAALFDLTMLMYTRGGLCYALADLRALCGAAGLSPSEHVYVSDQRFSLLIAGAPAK